MLPLLKQPGSRKSVTVILLNPVFMPELFSVLGEPLNCQCSFSHLPLLSPATLPCFPVVGCVLYVFVTTYLQLFSSSFFFLFCTCLYSAHNTVSLMFLDSSFNIIHFASIFLPNRSSSVMCLSYEASLSCACIKSPLLPKMGIHVSGLARTSSEVLVLP